MSKECCRLSPEARAKLKAREGLRSRSYRDAGGSEAICYGINQKYHPEIFESLGPSPTLEQCDVAFDKVLDKFEKGVSKYPNAAKLNQNQIDAMVMRAYNAGVSGALRGIKTDLQAQNWEAVATKMGITCLTDKDGGDLSRLRQEEKELFLRPVSPGLESDCSQQDTASSHEADFRTYASAPNIRIPIGEGMHMGVGFEPSGAPRFQIGFTCKMM